MLGILVSCRVSSLRDVGLSGYLGIIWHMCYKESMGDTGSKGV